MKDAEQSVENFSILTLHEEHQLLVEWNDTKAEYPEDKTIHQLFEEQAARTPDNIAVVYEDQELTYQQLNEKSNQLAHYLKTLGVGPDTLVAIAVERSLEMIIGLLGILKAGGAYVPLDPNYPQERLQFMLQDTNALVLITQSHLQKQLQDVLLAYTGRTVIIDQLEQNLQQQKIENLAHAALPHHLAYVIYTSGSTGKPKGVLVSHKNLSNCLASFRNSIQINVSDTFLAITNITFDIAGLEIYSPLLSGATLSLFHKDFMSNLDELKDLIKSKLTIMQATPTTWEILSDQDLYSSRDFRILCGGEALSLRLIKNLLSKAGNVWNLYGPTETTIWSSHKLYTQDEKIFFSLFSLFIKKSE